MAEAVPLYSGEAILLSWGESHRDGRVVRFKIEEDGTHPFKGLDTGVSGGQRFMLVAVPIQNDNGPARPVSGSVQSRGQNSILKPTQLDTTSKDGGVSLGSASAPPSKPNSTRAVMMCKDPEFQSFVAGGEAMADATIKRYCKVGSKADLNDGEGARLFEALRQEFREWRRSADRQ